MDSIITKSDFIRFLLCPRFAWLWKHKPTLRGEFNAGGRFAAQGREVEQLAHKLFPRGQLIEGIESDAFHETQRLMKEGAKVLYQATAMTDSLLAKADILVRDADGKRWHLYEVKSSSNIKEDYLADVYFQSLAFGEAGIRLASVNLILINSDYVYHAREGLKVDRLLSVRNLTADLLGMEIKWKAQIEAAHSILVSPEEPKVLVLNRMLKHELSHEMAEEYWKGTPEYSVYRITHITRGELVDLIGRGITRIEDVPEDYFHSERQARQIRITKSREVFIDRVALKTELGKFRYPLYFLDYETIMPAVPMFDGHKPYQTIPFQFSLHVIAKPGAKPKHYDYLHTRKSDPAPSLIRALKHHIGPKGTMLAWNAPFEKSCDAGMAARNPKSRIFLESMNERMIDLALLFKDIYVDYRFKGSISIKNVLPVMVPELSYEALQIRNGEMAIQSIHNLLGRTFFGRTKIIRELKEYCQLDTLAMVRIFQTLIEKLNGL